MPTDRLHDALVVGIGVAPPRRSVPGERDEYPRPLVGAAACEGVDPLLRDEIQEAVHAGIRELSPDYRLVLLLRDIVD